LFTSNFNSKVSNVLLRYSIGIILSLIMIEVTIRFLSPVLGPPLISWNTMQDAKLYKISEIVENGAQAPNLVIYGNSTAVIGVNPSIIEESRKDLKPFNMAMNGSDTLSMARLAIEKVGPLYQPRVMIFFLSQGSFRTSSDFSNHPYELAEPLLANNSILSHLHLSDSYIYKYRNLIRDPMILNSLRRSMLFFSNKEGIVVRWASNLDEKGYSTFSLSNNQIEGGWNYNTKSDSLDDFNALELPQGTIDDFSELKQYAEKNRIHIIISTVPTGSFDSNYRALSELLAQKFNFTFLQGNDAVTNGKYFEDGVHLNASGASIFSLWLGQNIPKFKN
jgi:hypothetical protein